MNFWQILLVEFISQVIESNMHEDTFAQIEILCTKKFLKSKKNNISYLITNNNKKDKLIKKKQEEIIYRQRVRGISNDKN